MTSCVQKAWAVRWYVIKSLHYWGLFPFHLLFLDYHNPRRPLFCVQGVFYSELFKVKLSLNLSGNHCLPPKPKWAGDIKWLSKWQRAWPLTECWTWLPNISLVRRTMTRARFCTREIQWREVFSNCVIRVCSLKSQQASWPRACHSLGILPPGTQQPTVTSTFLTAMTLKERCAVSH